METVFFRNVVVYALLAGTSASAIGQIDTTVAQDSTNFEVLEAVDNEVLDTMRGGFVTADGVRFDIGVEKTSFIDGVLQVQNTFRAEDVSLIQKEFGGTVSSGDLQNVASAFNTVIQNNLDQKTIQNFTIIDVNVKNIGNLQNNFVESMRSVQDLQLFK